MDQKQKQEFLDEEQQKHVTFLIARILAKVTNGNSITLTDRPLSDIQNDEFLPDNFADIVVLIMEVLVTTNRNPDLLTKEKERQSLIACIDNMILVYLFGYRGQFIQDRKNGISSQKFREAEVLLNAELAKKTI